MTPLLYPLLLLLASAPSPTLDQIRSDANPEHRAKAAVEYAAAAERAAELANGNGDDARMELELHNMVTAMELARDSFAAAGKTPFRQPGSFKNVELRSHEILHRLSDLRNTVDADEQHVLDGPIMKVQEIHDAWFDGIMGKKK
jgi:hypothetical protein